MNLALLTLIHFILSYIGGSSLEKSPKIETKFTTVDLILREKPSTNSKKLNIFPPGTELEVIKTETQDKINTISDYWYEVKDLGGYVFGGFLSDSRKSGIREVVLKSSSNVWNCENGYRADVFEKIVLKNNSFQYEYRDTEGGQKRHRGSYTVLKDGFVLEEDSEEENPWRVEFVYLEIINSFIERGNLPLIQNSLPDTRKRGYFVNRCSTENLRYYLDSFK